MDLDRYGWNDLETKLNDLSNEQAFKALQYLYWRGYENRDDELYSLLKMAIESGVKP
jgi:hypothetical protein